MSELVVVNFNDKYKADQTLLELLKLEQAHLSDLEDAVVVIKNADGKVRVKAYHDLLEPVPELGNDLWGGPISAIVFHRSLAIAQEIFDENFLIQVETALKPNTSALLVLVRSAEVDRVVHKLNEFDGKISRTVLSEKSQQKLRSSI